jgi:PKD repeat protein
VRRCGQSQQMYGGSGRWLFRLFVVVAAGFSLLGIGVGSAAASSVSYGEVSRFGGYEAEASGPKAGTGKFVTPEGFAVEPESPESHEKNAVYVLDQTYSEKSEGELDYRLQKLSSTGAVLGSIAFEERYTETEHGADAHPVVYLAVDPEKKRVYTVVQAVVEVPSSGGEFVPVAQKIDAWSTEPNASKELVRADPSEYPEDPVTKASIMAEFSASSPASDLFAPEGIVVDPVSHEVVVEAQAGLKPGSEGGPTVLQRVGVEGSDKGQLGSKWEVGAGLAPNGEPGGGLFTAADGTGDFGVALLTKTAETERLATVGNSLQGEGTLLASESVSAQAYHDHDEAPLISSGETPNWLGSEDIGTPGLFTTYAPGSPVTQLDGDGDPYAALYAENAGGPSSDGQAAEPWQKALGGEAIDQFWITGTGADSHLGNVGIRLFNAQGEVIDTIGGGEPSTRMSGSCSIDYAHASLAAGADGSVFVLTKPNEQRGDTDDEVIQFAPGQGSQCPSVTGELSVNGKELVPGQGGAVAAVSVDPGVETEFSALSLDRPLAWNLSEFTWHTAEWIPFAIEWNFEGASTGGPGDDGYTVVHKIDLAESAYQWPEPKAEYKYETPGIYEAKLRVYGDLGTSVFPFKVHVLGSTPPKAEFTVPGIVTAGEAVSFDGFESAPTPGSEIEDYHWEFGDGSAPVDTGSQAEVQHAFSQAGEYTVKLTIHDSEGSVKEASIEHKVLVAAAAATHEKELEKQPEDNTGPPTDTSPTNTTTTPSVITPTMVPPKPKPLTPAQKLARALKACAKVTAKSRRVNCERLAKRKYALEVSLKACTKLTSKKKRVSCEVLAKKKYALAATKTNKK